MCIDENTSGRATASSDEVHDERDHCKEQKQMNEQTRALEHYETAEPQSNQNNCKYEKHGAPAFLFQECRANCREIASSERAGGQAALLGSEINSRDNVARNECIYALRLMHFAQGE
jgi:hypothetical protein